MSEVDKRKQIMAGMEEAVAGMGGEKILSASYSRRRELEAFRRGSYKVVKKPRV